MKRVILPAILLGAAMTTYAQNSLRETVRGEGGITKHFVTLRPDQQTLFSEKTANAVLNFDPQLTLSLKKSEQDELGNINYRFTQFYKDIPVEGAMYIVQTSGGKATAMSGAILTAVTPALKSADLTKTIPKETAVTAAIKTVGAEQYAWQNPAFEQKIKQQTGNAAATYAPAATLVWFDKGTGDDIAFNPANLVLAYKIDVYATQPLSRAYYFIDAQTGKLLDRHDIIQAENAPGTANTYWSGTQKINSTKDSLGSTYRLRDYTKGNGVITLHGESGQFGSDYTSNSATWTLTGMNQAAMDVHYGVSSTYTFYKNVFKRNSYDDNGAALTSYVNITGGTDNAFWDGSAMNFYARSTGENGGTTGIDVTGHELTHGVTQETSELIYKNESGAMNESMSDIMGKCVQFYTKPNDINWQLSNDMGWIIRDMSNPNLLSQPDTYKGKYWAKGLLAALDNGGVHTNSGIGNYMFYLLVSGGSGTNDSGWTYNVKAIGNKAAFIMYRTETVYLFPSAVYADWRTASINAATDLYGATSQTVKSVKDAFHAIGIGEASTASVVASTPVAELKVIPNPVVGGSSVVAYELLAKGNAVFTLTSVNNARAVQTVSLGNLAAGKYTYRLATAANLPAGNYVLSLTQNNVLVSKTPIIITK